LFVEFFKENATLQLTLFLTINVERISLLKKRHISKEWWERRASKPTVISLGVLHVIALCALLPEMFSWSGVGWFCLLYWVSGGLGITLCYHRLLTHRSFKTPLWLRTFLTTCGCLAMQGSPIVWVGTHRFHHKHSDQELDPHSPVHGFSWSHMLWVLTKAPKGFRAKDQARDLQKDAAMRLIDKLWLVPQLLVTLLLFVSGWIIEDLTLGCSWVVWGVALRTIVVFHTTWFVNSASHLWGYQNFPDTGDNSRNVWWVALLTFGEGWHNNHHHDPSSAAHGMRWFEYDMTYWTIRLLQAIGLASDIREPKDIPG